jgi:TolB-like protein
MRSASVTRVLCCALGLALVAPPAAARRRSAAGKERLAVIPLSTTGAGADAAASALVRGLLKAFKHAKKVQTLLVGQGREEKFRLCLQKRSCVRAVARQLRVRYFLTGHVTAQGGGYHVDLRVVSARTGDGLASDSATVDRGEEAVRLAATLVDSARKAQPAPAPEQEEKEDNEEPVTDSDAKLAAAIIEQRDTEDPTASPEERKRAAEEARRAAKDKEPDLVVPPGWTPRITSARYWHFWTTAAAGIAAIGTGVVFGVISKQAVDAGREAPSQRQSFIERDKAKKNAMVANILFGAGGALVLTSGLLLFLEYRSERADAARPRYQLGMNLGGGGGTLCVTGEF